MRAWAMRHLHNAGKSGNIGQLLHRRQEATMPSAVAVGFQLIEDEAFQVAVDVAPSGHPHVGHKARRYLILHRSNAANEFELLHYRGSVGVWDMCMRRTTC